MTDGLTYGETLTGLRGMIGRARAIVGRVERQGLGPLGSTTLSALVMYGEALEREAGELIGYDEFLDDSYAPRTVETAWALRERRRRQ